MPIFMDRHDMREATAENVAEAHRRDLDIQDRYGVRYMTYWFDPDRGTGFCFVDAPDAATAERVHREAHGKIASDIIEVDPVAVEAFLGRIGGPHGGGEAPAPGAGPALRAVMFTDIVGSTAITTQLGDAAALDLVRAHDALVRRSLDRYGGREIKRTGDGIMAAFDDVAGSVRAAADIQQRFAAYNEHARHRLNVRIGIHAGEPVADHNDLFGTTVQLAARLCDEAEVDGVVVSREVRDLCVDSDLGFEPVGALRLKGFAEPVAAFRLAWRRDGTA